MFRTKIFWLIAIAIELLLCKPWSAQACPGCGVANDATVGQGFNMSIVFLMAMPFVVFGSAACGLIYYYHQRNNQNHATEPQQKRGEEH